MIKGKIAFFIPTCRGGGAERVMVTFANAFAKKGIQTDLVVCSLTGPYVDEIDKRVNVFDLKKDHVSRSLPALLRYIRKNKPTAMVSSLVHANIIAVIAKLLSREKFRLAIREASTPSMESKAGNSPFPVKTRLVSFLQRRLYKYADFVIAPSKGVALDLVENKIAPESKVHVIYNPVDIEMIQKRMKEPVSHPWFQGNDQVILAVGRLTKQKDYPTLLRAFSIVSRKVSCKLVILGEGEKRKELEELVKELGLEGKVDMPGFVENPFAYMARASVFVLSSLWEGLPNVIIQAMVCGTPVVATDCPSGPREILEDGRYGRLAPPGDWGKIADEIFLSLSKVHKQQENKERANFFSVDRSVNILFELLNLLETGEVK
ncbi:MAG: glycosyltransferase [Acetomicrobium sp.]